MTIWILIGLTALNLLLVLWLLWRPAPSNDAALAQMTRDLRDELQRSASGTRQELGQGMAQSMGLLQQTLVTQQGDATRTQNEQLDSFRVQLAGMQQGLADTLRDTAHQSAQQSNTLREAQTQALSRFNEAQESALKRLSEDKFCWPRREAAVARLTTEQLHWILEGLDIEVMVRHPVRHYQLAG